MKRRRAWIARRSRCSLIARGPRRRCMPDAGLGSAIAVLRGTARIVAESLGVDDRVALFARSNAESAWRRRSGLRVFDVIDDLMHLGADAATLFVFPHASKVAR